jgi:DNA-binding transcriptional LysR family regulator
MLDWDDLRFVLAVARAGSLSGAARALRVEHTTVGRRLASIERALGARLFDRTPKGHLPTAAGATVIARAEAVEEQIQALEREVEGGDRRAVGTVRISALDPFITEVLLPALPALAARHPGIEVLAATETRVVSLADREADIAIRPRPEGDPFVARRLATVVSGMYASAEYLDRHGHPRGPDEMAGHTRVALVPDLARAPEERWFAERAPVLRVAVRVDTPGAYRAAVREGLGVGMVECHAAERAGLVRLWPEPLLSEEWWAVAHDDIARSARIRAVLDFLEEMTAGRAAALAGGEDPGPDGAPDETPC